MKHSVEALITVSVLVILLAGAFVSSSTNYGYDAKLSYDDSSLFFEGAPAEYVYAVMFGAEPPENIYLYYDENRECVGTTNYNVNRFNNNVEKLISIRSDAKCAVVNADELKVVMKSDYDAYVVMVSGALPDTVYETDENSTLENWVKGGGRLYWSGPDIGTYRSTNDGIQTINHSIFFNEGDICGNDDGGLAYTSSDLFKLYPLTNTSTSFGLRSDYEGSKVLGLCSNEGYSTTSVVKINNGELFIFAGSLVHSSIEYRTYFIDILLSGIDSDTTIVEDGQGKKGNGSIKINLDTTLTNENTVFITVLKPNSIWSKTIEA